MTPQFSKLPLFAPPVEARDLTFGTEQASGNISASSMLKIESLLNHPTSVETRYDRIAGPSNSFSPRMQTPDSFGLFKRPKLVKDAPVFVKGETKGQVHYPPFESLEDAISLTPWQRDELIRQHHHFKIYPSGGQKDGLISDCPRHIPYSSDKKDFMGKSGFEGFDVFTYTFVVPGTTKEHAVLWDYNSGLVRITPFFKACDYSKTTPAKAINANPGLREMSLPITGGALVAQGYWMPYSCARAICLTFAYDIRWALTPIFGPSFIRECLERHHRNFACFKIDPEIIRCAEMSVAASQNVMQVQQEIPRSVPDEHHHYTQQTTQARPVFKTGSPFDSESDISRVSNPYGLATDSALNSPAISPRSTALESSGWTAVNQRANFDRNTSPSAPPNTRVSSLDNTLLTDSPHTPWHSAQASGVVASTSSVKRARRSSTSNYDDGYSDNTSTSSSESSSESEVVTGNSYTKPTLRGIRHQQKAHGGSPYTAASRSETPPLKKSKKYTAEDFRAARLLLELSQDPGSSISEGSGMYGGGKGKGKGRSKW